MSPTPDSPSSSSSESKPTAPPFSSLFQSGYGEHPSEIPPSDSDDPDSPYFNEISGTSAGAISAAVISALAFIFFVAAGYMIYSRRRRARIVPTAAGSEMLGPHSAHRESRPSLSRIMTDDAADAFSFPVQMQVPARRAVLTRR
ncbi:hypothetical protein BDV98DRAFT_130846, partial [Pterulicium gracile]